MAQFSADLRPHLLRPDNFTPAARTPWGGRRIVGQFKAALGLPTALAEQPVGEAWELSFGPELPSQTDDGRSLRELAAQYPLEYLGAESAQRASALLVKWLDAAQALSVQIHPSVDDPQLGAAETGKPECWYIVACEPRAGIYLGLQPGVTSEQMRAALDCSADVSRLLRFREVAAGDFYLLPPGLPHAVGPGVTLVEPQYVAPGKQGVTLRYWDWNRRYDAAGRPDPNGRSRELHVERALAVTDWRRAADDAWLSQQRALLGGPRPEAAARVQLLCGPEPDAHVHSLHLRAARLDGSGWVQLPSWPTLCGLTVIEGEAALLGEFGCVRVRAGTSAAIPAALTGLRCELTRAHALVSSVVSPDATT